MNLYFDESAYKIFIELCHRYADIHKVSILALCLMPNHFHLLLRIEEDGDLTEFMKRLSQTFSRRVNKSLRRKGTIFEGRYFASHVDTDSYLMAAFRYIHLNPVRAGLVSHPATWEYSNVQEVLGLRSYIRSNHDLPLSLFHGRHRYEIELLDKARLTMIDHPTLAKNLAEAGFL